MLASQQFDIKDFNRYLIRGTDKTCYVSDKYPGKILKISPLAKANQILREISYFEFLRKRGVSPSFMPKFYGRYSDDKTIGYVQELIFGNDIKSLWQAVPMFYGPQLEILEEAILNIRREMIEKNIIILDLHSGNILCNIKTLKMWIIEGYGTSEFIPLPQYCRFFGRLKIERQWKKFVFRYGKQLSALAKQKGEWVPSLIVPAPVE